MKKILSVLIVLAMALSMGIGALAEEPDWADYQEYVYSFAAAGAPTPEDAASMADVIHGCATMDELLAAPELGVFFAVLGAMDYDAWVAAGKPAEGEPAASGEASGEASDDAAVREAYIEYLHEWLIAEDEVNDTMTEEIRENEFMPLIYAWDFETFPAEMLWGDMLVNGNPMTFEEFAAQYQPAGAASGEPSGEAPAN